MRWGAVLPDQPGLSIGCDNVGGGRLAGEHLWSLGRRQIAFLGDASSHYPEFLERFDGCDSALRDAGSAMDRALQVDAESSEESGEAAAHVLLSRGLPDGNAASDLIAIGAMRVFAEHGLRIPEIAVRLRRHPRRPCIATPALTTIHQTLCPASCWSRGSSLVEGEPAASERLPTSLVVRRSTVAA